MSVAALHFHTKTLSAACAGEQGVRPQWSKFRGGSCFGRFTNCFPVGSGYRSSAFPSSASLLLRPWRHLFRTRFVAGFGSSARQGFRGKPRSCKLWHHRFSLWCSNRQHRPASNTLGSCCLTTHSSRRCLRNAA